MPVDPVVGREGGQTYDVAKAGDILKCVAEGGKVQPTFRFFM